ncbi:hypothetical protein PRZ48_003103 [Zasmidium cellare]|uniref:HOOK N-terminal domain-containing protein n=1 Tax=Zasmidium cellare TaxID=395010 RepID=A0ABR0EVL7_ZASCE|nr:hypothetical protein PRZ48_003103 [Zasmidium cellare]
MAAPDPSISLSTALLAWVQSFEDTVTNLASLNDGLTLWKILHTIDPSYFTGSLPEPSITPTSDWTRKWQNLKHVEKQLAMYYRDVCNGAGEGGDAVDLKVIAEEGKEGDLERLIMRIIRAAMASPESNQGMGRRLMGLGQERAMVIAYEIQRMQEDEGASGGEESVSRDEGAWEGEVALPNGKSKESGGMFGDPLLEREEELLQAQATIETLQAQLADAKRQVQAAKQHEEQLRQELDNYRDEMNNKGRRPAGDDDYKKLQRQADSDRAYIDDLENQLQASKDAVEKYERQVMKFKEEQEASQKLRDDLQMLRAENEDLNQKVKANENLKKKIQTLQEQEKANASLREELKQAGERLGELDSMRQVQAGLEKEIIEKKGLIRNQEYQINELTTTRKHVEYDAKVLAQKLEAARERQERDHEALEELRARLVDRGPDEEVDIEPPQPSKDASADDDTEKPPAAPKTDENKHYLDKISLLEQQLSAADARLKQASQRASALEDAHNTGRETTSLQLEKSSQRIEEQDNLIADLKRELERQAGMAPPPPQDVAVLQREVKLVCSAWYDLGGRLQRDGVSLAGRRREARSWIGRQRGLVGPGGGVGVGR